MSEASPLPGRAYTPEQVHENGWLGDVTPGAMRAAVSHGDWPCTKIRRKVHFTAENIAAIIAAGQEDAKTASPTPSTSRRSPRRVPVQLADGVQPLRPRPQAARRRRASA